MKAVSLGELDVSRIGLGSRWPGDQLMRLRALLPAPAGERHDAHLAGVGR